MITEQEQAGKAEMEALVVVVLLLVLVVTEG